MPPFARVVLWLSALLFLGFGVWLVVDPGGLAAVGLPVAPDSLWRIEIRAFYGGLEIGFAGFLILCALRPGWELPGLAATTLMLGGAGTARLVGMLLQGMDRGMLIAMASELGGAALAAVTYRVTSRQRS